MSETEVMARHEDIDGERLWPSPDQSRAGRGWLDWSQEDLARKAGVSPSTVRDFEKGRRLPIGNNMSAITEAFCAAGIFFDENGVYQLH